MSQVRGAKEPEALDFIAFYSMRKRITLVPKNVTHNKKGRYSEPHSYTFLYFCNLFHIKLLDFLQGMLLVATAKKKIQEYMIF